MTKQLKKGLIAVLMVVFVAFSCVAIFGAVTTARADATADRKSSFESKMTYFEEYYNTNAGITDAILNTEHHSAYREMKLAYDALVKNGENVDYDNATTGIGYISKLVRNVYADAQNVLDVMGGRIIDIYDLISTNELYYYYKAEVDAAYSKFLALSANEQAFVNTYSNNLYFYNELTSELTLIKGRIDTAIESIKAIDYYDGTTFVTTATDFTALPAQEIVLSSLGSIEDAFGVVELIYNRVYDELPADEKEYSTELATAYGYLTTAQGAYDDITEEAGNQQAALQTVIDYCVEHNVYYTYKTEIENAKLAYESYLNNSKRENAGVNVNDVATLITNFAIEADNDQEFMDLVARVNSMQSAIDGVVADIAAIYAEFSNEIKYVESLSEIEDAEEAFAALDEDIRLADTAVGATTYFVTGEISSVVYDYADLVTAREKYDLLDAEIYGSDELDIEGLKPMTERLIGICEEGDAATTFENLYAEIESVYTHDLTVEQKQVVDTMTFTYDSNKDGVDENYGMFALLTKIMQYTNSLKANSSELISEIDDLYTIYTGDNAAVITNNSFITGLLEVYSEFYAWVGNTAAHEEKLGVAFEGTAKDVNIYPYVKAAEVKLLTMYKARLDAVAAAQDWLDAVDAMDAVITTANWSQFADAKVEYDELKITNLALFNCLNVQFAEEYEKYTNTATCVADIENKIVAVVAKMKAIDLGLVDFNNFVPADITVFTGSVIDATAAYDALCAANGGKDITDTYLSATTDFTKDSVIHNCQEAFENYETALTYVDPMAVETLIINLYGANTDTSFIDITYADTIANIKQAYDALDNDEQQKVRNYESTTIVQTYRNAADALAVITDAYDAWIKTVAAIVNPEVADGLTKTELLDIIDDGLTAISAPNVTAVATFATYKYYYFDIDNYTGIVNNYSAFFTG
ncbi:MAG: hypothetical protein IJB32_04490, partial [Clostridia bacterium]|nr:hypothetical protein [Clostridia bacterium]